MLAPDIDPKVIGKAVQGDGQAFALVLEQYYDFIFRVAFQWMGNEEDAEDLTQEVCVKLAKAIRKFRQESKFTTWLYRVIINQAKDSLRKKQRQPKLSPVDPEISENLASDEGGEQSERAKTLWESVALLPEKQRDTVRLIYQEGLTHAEAAEVMQCAEKTISWYIHEAKKALKSQLS